MESRRNAWLALVLMMAGGPVLAAEPLALAANELASGDYTAALNTLDNLPRATAKGAEARFLRGTALMGSGRLEEAAALFEALLADQPQLPEAYNNLAAVYVRQGRLDEAKQVLERALATDPRYATVYANLSTIYVEQARSSYAKALRLDAGAQAPKLAIINSLHSPAAAPAAPVVVATVEPVVSTKAAPPVAPAVVAKNELPAESTPVSSPATVSTAPGRDPAPDRPAQAPASVAVTAAEVIAPASTPVVVAVAQPPAAAPPVEAVPERLRLALLNAVEGWARAWSEQNPDKYLAYYAADYAPEGMARSAWEDERRSRLSRPAWIKVTLEEQEVGTEGDEVAVVTFKQRYASPSYKDITLKRLTLALRDGNWVITSETNLKVRR